MTIVEFANRAVPDEAVLFFYSWSLLEKGGKNENDRVAPPEMSIHTS